MLPCLARQALPQRYADLLPTSEPPHQHRIAVNLARMRRLQVAWPERNDGYTYTDLISSRSLHVGLSVLEFYTKQYESSGGRDRWIERIEAGEVTVNGQPPGPPLALAAADTYRLRQGDVCKYSRQPWSEPPAPSYLDLLYEDEHVVAVAKPRGLQVMPAGPFFQRTALQILQQHYGGAAASGAGGNSKLGVPTPVHRLGRGTSGTLLCARTPEARRRLSELMTHATQQLPAALTAPPTASRQRPDGEQFREGGGGAAAALAQGGATMDLGGSARPCGTQADQQQALQADATAPAPNMLRRSLRKLYRARCTGIIPSNQGLVDCPIGLVEHPGVAAGVHAACAREHGGKAALSRYRVLHRDHGSDSTLVEVEIFSGRSHQIRIHMACIGHPLLGDPMYAPGGVPQAGTSGGVDGTADSSRPGDCGSYLLHAHVLEIPLLGLGLLGSTHHQGLEPRQPVAVGLEDQHARIDAAGFLLLKAPLPVQLMTPEELEQRSGLA